MSDDQKVSISVSEYIDLKVKSLTEKYDKSENLLKETKIELDKRLDATFATIREVDGKIEVTNKSIDIKIDRALVRIYVLMFSTILLLIGGLIAHIMGKV
jgi:hypothetical protein